MAADPARTARRRARGARLYTAGRGLAAPNAGPGSPALRPSAAGVTSEEEGRQLVGELAAQRVSFVKIWVDDRGGTVEKLAPAFYRAIIDEAHRRGLQVIAHVFYHDDAEDLVAAGVDGFAHLVRDREMDDALVAAIVAQDVFVMPNLGVSERRRHTQPPAWLREPLLASTVAPACWNGAASYAGFARGRPRPGRASTPGWSAACGSCMPRAPTWSSLGRRRAGPLPGVAAHREIELFVAAGLPPMDALAIATSRPALRLRQVDAGRLSLGTRADFVALDANPLDDITATRRIAGVYLDGEAVDREALRAAWSARSGS